MAKYRSPRILPIALVLIVVAVAIAALVSVVRVVFFPASSGNETSQVEIGKENLLSTSSGHAVRMLVRGGIVADETFRSYQVVISPSARTLTTYKGYLDQKIDSARLSNNVRAYEEFVYALNRADLVEGKPLGGDGNDLRGVCATGILYVFDVIKNNKSIYNLWTSTCKGNKGSLSANISELRVLFLDQIPNSAEIVNKIDL